MYPSQSLSGTVYHGLQLSLDLENLKSICEEISLALRK